MKINSFVYILITVLLLVGLFFIVKSQTNSTLVTQNPSSNISTNSGAVATDSAIPQNQNSKTFEIIVKNRKLVSGPDSIQVNQGDDVIIKITVDEDEELHLHGYDKMVDLTKDQPAELKFTANLTGRFPYELEHSKTEIGALEVLPK